MTIESIQSLQAPAESRHSVAILLDMIEDAAPLPPSHRKAIRFDVLDLWRDLTSERSTRQADYIGEPAKFAAYLRYFLPWNVVRLIPILAALELPPGDFSLLDIGSGPLTLPIALWIARPDLRERKLTITCSDRVRRIMDTGLTIFDGLRLRHNAAKADQWTIKLHKLVFPATNEAETGRHDLVCAANVFNESFWKDKTQLDERAAELAGQLSALVKDDGRLLLVEPGDPRSGSMLAAIREALILDGGAILGPCTHQKACPMPGVFMSQSCRDLEGERPPISPVLMPKGRHKMPWCHFVLDSGAAPDKLLAFSANAGLPKDRLVASWLYAEPATMEADDDGDQGDQADKASKPTPPATTATPAAAVAQKPHGSSTWPKRSLRIISDAFKLRTGGYARYACGSSGYLLACGQLARLESGSRVILVQPLPDRHGRKDPKSGAIIVDTNPLVRQAFDNLEAINTSRPAASRRLDANQSANLDDDFDDDTDDDPTSRPARSEPRAAASPDRSPRPPAARQRPPARQDTRRKASRGTPGPDSPDRPASPASTARPPAKRGNALAGRPAGRSRLPDSRPGGSQARPKKKRPT
ncbi:MAG: hypothetical protein A2087_11690 [Spirochaetes bacterium GWD1_61_31]|nr:MAG: hypothetical protein A2Y37_14920 [Spirochaetes bacterium GWB1_60_80]OHD30308.1 MAG: hypothetical protein A2004_02805 [Spirochaetes bacterium GWC1_61_12]OHD35861.1 MAG: hypothetical protein A2087_11690 [Spirochaetes bacterium GWD1_61_31]OHD46803.1 MAG: hypothetical protein A2Y35_10860 [Spirochaetes bacterium GWE1_60_18]OHD61255.1 MAG: hypothetical protein A2Y32_13155 [Spirochaetes bacterium GWF1_60_12]HAW85739.1 hypothetical protein [Spirochaetaceae bacterium]